MNHSAGLAPGLLSGETLAAEPIADEDLARRGDAQSFALLYARHLPLCIAICQVAWRPGRKRRI
jgi:hypothetical protein